MHKIIRIPDLSASSYSMYFTFNFNFEQGMRLLSDGYATIIPNRIAPHREWSDHELEISYISVSEIDY